MRCSGQLQLDFPIKHGHNPSKWWVDCVWEILTKNITAFFTNQGFHFLALFCVRIFYYVFVLSFLLTACLLRWKTSLIWGWDGEYVHVCFLFCPVLLVFCFQFLFCCIFIFFPELKAKGLQAYQTGTYCGTHQRASTQPQNQVQMKNGRAPQNVLSPKAVHPYEQVCQLSFIFVWLSGAKLFSVFDTFSLLLSAYHSERFCLIAV